MLDMSVLKMACPQKEDKMDKTMKRHSDYFSRAFGSIETIADEMLEEVQSVEFDTMVGTGLSGTLVVPTLARAFGTYWAIVRKENSPHSSYLIEGEIGHKWLFVDDIIDSGSTLKRVKEAIADEVDRYNGRYYRGHSDDFVTEYVGTYQYERKVYRAP